MMQSLTLHETAAQKAPFDLVREIYSLEATLTERRTELVALQRELRTFKEHYARVVGSRLAELGEVERAILEAEASLFNLDAEAESKAEAENMAAVEAQHSGSASGKTALRKLFWSVARL